MALNRVDATGMGHIAAAAIHAGSHAVLTSLGLASNALGREGAAALARALAAGALPLLEQLDLGANEIGSEGLAALVHASLVGVSSLRAVTQLRLDHNSIDDGAVRFLAAQAVLAPERVLPSLGERLFRLGRDRMLTGIN